MQLCQSSMAVSGGASGEVAAFAVSCVERLETLTAACLDKCLARESVRVLGGFISYANSTTGAAWPSQRRVARDLEMTPPQLSRAVKELEACGYLVRRHEVPLPGMAACTVYHFVARQVPARASAPRAIHIVPVAVPEAEVTNPGNHSDERVTSPGNSELPAPVTQELPNPVSEPGELNPENEPGETDPSGPGAAPPKPRAAKGQKPEPLTQIPADWVPKEKTIQLAMASAKLTREQVIEHAANFVDYHRGRGTLSAAWHHDWRRWLRQISPGGRLRHLVEAPTRGIQPRSATSNLGMTAEEMAAYVQTHPTGGWT